MRCDLTAEICSWHIRKPQPSSRESLEKGIAEMVVSDQEVVHKRGRVDKRKGDERRRQQEEKSLTKLTGSFRIEICFWGAKKGIGISEGREALRRQALLSARHGFKSHLFHLFTP